MKRITGMMALAAAAAWTSGCVGLDKHRQLEMHNRTLAAENDQVNQDLHDCRSVTDNLRNKLASVEGELDTKTLLVGNLQQENDRLAAAFERAQNMLETMAGKDLTQPVVITQQALPEMLDSALQRFASQYPSAVEYDARRGMIKWKSDLLFAFASDVVRESAKGSLAGFAKIMSSSDAQGFDIIVVGHTDNVPIKRDATRQAHPTNWHLSVHRSIAVSDVLQADGVSPTRIGVMGYSKYRPVRDNDTEENRATNRRVAMYILPTGSIVSASAEPTTLGADS